MRDDGQNIIERCHEITVGYIEQLPDEERRQIDACAEELHAVADRYPDRIAKNALQLVASRAFVKISKEMQEE